VESPAPARQVIEQMGEGLRPENACRVLLDEDDNIYWPTGIDGSERRYYNEPESAFWQRFMSGFIVILSIE